MFPAATSSLARMVTFTAPCPCGRMCEWVTRTGFDGTSMTKPTYEVGCDCAP